MKKDKFTNRGCFISNYHFDTTAAHVQLNDCDPVNVICDESKDILNYHPFKCNFDLKKLEDEIISKGSDNVVGIISTITCNSVGGQPVSMDNIKKTSIIAKKHNLQITYQQYDFINQIGIQLYTGTQIYEKQKTLSIIP